jgi:ABC-2 type transport system permease protein
MNPAAYDAGAHAPDPSLGTPSAARLFYWSLRRELWEYRSIWIAPIVVGVVGVIGFLVTTPGLPGRVRALAGPGDMETAHIAIHGPYGAAAILLLATAFVVGVFYCLEALQGERRDRSILFWKSLPVSDRMTVLSKASIPLVVLPLIAFAITSVMILFMVLVSTAVLLAGSRPDIALMWDHVQPFQFIVAVLYTAIAIALWHAPIYAALLLVSGTARRTALLWAALPLVAVPGIERLVFNSTRFVGFLKGLLLGWIPRAYRETSDTELLAALTPGRFLSTPSLWVGLAVAAALLVLAIRLRRSREPV